MRIIVAAALCFLIAFGVGLLLPPSTVKSETCPPKITRVLTVGTRARYFLSFSAA
jgi:hypothetical protein